MGLAATVVMVTEEGEEPAVGAALETEEGVAAVALGVLACKRLRRRAWSKRCQPFPQRTSLCRTQTSVQGAGAVLARWGMGTQACRSVDMVPLASLASLGKAARVSPQDCS